jgi:hypothetical protein
MVKTTLFFENTLLQKQETGVTGKSKIHDQLMSFNMQIIQFFG